MVMFLLQNTSDGCILSVYFRSFIFRVYFNCEKPLQYKQRVLEGNFSQLWCWHWQTCEICSFDDWYSGNNKWSFRFWLLWSKPSSAVKPVLDQNTPWSEPSYVKPLLDQNTPWSKHSLVKTFLGQNIGVILCVVASTACNHTLLLKQ